METKREKEKWQWAAAALFGLALALPTFSLALGIGTSARQENRQLAPFPEFPQSWSGVVRWLGRFSKYYDDHFGFRGACIYAHGFLKLRVLGDSPTRDVVLGKDGQLFYNLQDDMEMHRGLRPFEPGELAWILRAVKRRQDWAARHGIAYLLVIGPEAQTLNPEKLPDWAAAPAGTRTRLDAFMEVANQVGLHVIDLRPALLRAKADHRVSLRTDTHWNHYGSYVAYREILQRLAKEVPGMPEPIPLQEYEFRNETRDGLDLAIQAGLTDLIKETGENLFYTGKTTFDYVDRRAFNDYGTHTASGNPIRVAFVTDSIGQSLNMHFARQFRDTRVFWKYDFKPSDILPFKPRILINLLIERRLIGELFRDSESLDSGV